MTGLTMEDVNLLKKDPSPAVRAGTAAKLAQQFNASAFAPAELALAEQIFRLMVRDAEVRVREALSANLRANPRLPHDVAVSLARDVDSVALPILSASEVLTAEDLLQIIASQGSPSRLDAIAGRREVDARVSDAIVQNGSETVVAKLLANPGAAIAEPTFHKVVDKFGHSEAVQEPLVHRDALPITIVERLVTRVAEHLRTHLLSTHKISSDIALELILQTRERATVGLAMGVSEESLKALVAQLQDNNRLTGSIVLRAICMGNLRFFEHALARLAALPVDNARALIHDPGSRGLQTIWTKARLPDAGYPAAQAALSVIAQTELDGRDLDPERYSRRIIERILTQYENIGVEFDNDDLEYLLAKVAQVPAASLAVH
ncbi:MAG: DUF2336 domain-containing protein [Proteobacteria bacterium]|nr:DUF2336 domain-containing protein [Pseudomonadota bacterium]